MNVSRCEYRLSDERFAVSVDARLDGRRIGYVRCIRTGDRLKIGDLFVEPVIARRWPKPLRGILSVLRVPPRSWTPRGHGIGGELLARVLQHADLIGIREVWGDVERDDLAAMPHLLAMYVKRGFVAEPPDAECNPHAVFKIVRRHGTHA